AQAEPAGAFLHEGITVGTRVLHAGEWRNTQAACPESHARFGMGRLVLALVTGLDPFDGSPQQQPAVDVLVDLAEPDAAMRVPPFACRGRVQHALGITTLVVIDAVLDLLGTDSLAECETDHAGAANAVVFAHEPAAELEVDSVETTARQGA